MSCSESGRNRKIVENNKKQSTSLWSNEDDISLVKGMVDYELQTLSNPYHDMGKFFEFIKPSIHFDVKRKRMTDRLCRLKKRFILNSKFDTRNPHCAYMFKLCKMVKAWGNGVICVDDGKCDSVADDGNVEDENVVVDDVNVLVNDDIGGGQCSKNVEIVISKGQNVQEDDNVDGAKKCSQQVKNKKKGKALISDAQSVEQGAVLVDEVHGGKCSKVHENKKKPGIVATDQKVHKENLVVNDVVDGGKCSKVVKKKKKGKFVISNTENVQEDNLVPINGGQNVQEDNKGKGEVVINGGQNVVEVNLVGQNIEEEKLVGNDVGGGKCSILLKHKNKRKVVNVESTEKNGKKRVTFVGIENVPKEVMKTDWNDFTSLYPDLTKAMELETLSMMPLQIKKNSMMDTINSMGREKANEEDEKWADLYSSEIELQATKIELASEQLKLFSEVMRR